MFFSCLDKQYIAIIGDIKNSRKIDNRKEVQTKLNGVLDEINQTYCEEIAAGFLITLGDEFQGLLLNGKSVMKMIQKIEKSMYPIELRYGIGIGTITTDINAEMALGADGPAFYKARNAIDCLKANENKKCTALSDIRIESEDGSFHQNLLINTIFELLKSVKDQWTDRQREIIWDMLEHQNGKNHAAERLGISQPTVQKGLAKGNYYIYKNAVENIEKVLGEIYK
jgi:hypothetical protein